VAEARAAGGGRPKEEERPPRPHSRSPEKAADSEWRPATNKKVEGSGRSGRASRAVKNKKTLYTDQSTEDEEEEEVPAVHPPPPTKPAALGPVFSHSGRNYKDLYVEHLAGKPHLEESNPFSALLAAANHQNASEFELPLRLGHHSQKFPFSWRWSSEADRRRQKGTDGDEVEPRDRDKVRLCYTCVRSSRLGPLVSCDFCPCAFHMDCLDPPLSEVPTDVWMCPNHVENFLDRHLLASSSATERVRLWEDHARQPVDAHAVKLQFLRRAHRASSRHFTRRPAARSLRRRARVPGHVKELYRRPGAPPGGALREGRCSGSAGEQEDEWLAGVVTLQTQLAGERVARVEEGRPEEVKPEAVPVPPELAAQLAEYLAQHRQHAPVAALDPAVLQYLALRQLQQLLPAPGPPGAVRARACLTPLAGRRAPTLMSYRALAVGAGEVGGLDLLQYGACSHLSAKHATIFYDELSGTYELLNYSAHGTRVDSVLYSLDLAGVEARFPQQQSRSPAAAMAGPVAGAACPCRPGARAGCEGSALLRHGAILQFGCIQFLFSLAEEDGHCAEA
jgi:hypothetical protein